MRVVNATCLAKDLKPGDLWVRVLNEDEPEIVQVTEVKHIKATATRKAAVHITYDVLYQWANDATYTEGSIPDKLLTTLVITETDTADPRYLQRVGKTLNPKYRAAHESAAERKRAGR